MASTRNVAWPMRIHAQKNHKLTAEELAEQVTAAGITVKKVASGYVYFEYKVPFTVNNHYEAAEVINTQFQKKWKRQLVPL